MNELRLFDPFLLDPIDDGFRSLMRPWRTELDERAPQIRADITEADGHYIVQADVPGVTVKSVPLLMSDPDATAAMVRAGLDMAGVSL